MGSPAVEDLSALDLSPDDGPPSLDALLRFSRRGNLAPFWHRPALAVAAFGPTAARLSCTAFVHCPETYGQAWLRTMGQSA